MHFITTATIMHYYKDKDHKLELRSNRNNLTNHTKSKLCHSYLWPQGWIHNIYIHTYVHIHMKVIQKTNLKWL